MEVAVASGMGCLGSSLAKVRVRLERALRGGSSERRVAMSGKKRWVVVRHMTMQLWERERERVSVRDSEMEKERKWKWEGTTKREKNIKILNTKLQ